MQIGRDAYLEFLAVRACPWTSECNRKSKTTQNGIACPDSASAYPMQEKTTDAHNRVKMSCEFAYRSGAKIRPALAKRAEAVPHRGTWHAPTKERQRF